MVNAIRTALARTDIVILMGGLGPTEDDLTREATAEALSISLRRDAAQVAALHTRAATWRISMPSNNLKQADVLQGATLLPNPNGSAPGQWLDVTFNGYRKLVALLPGPPNECQPLFDSECLPRLRDVVPPRSIAARTLKAAMIPESQADKLLAPIYSTYSDVETTILAHAGDLQLTLICSKPTIEAAQRRVDELAGRLEEALDEWIYSSQGDTLEQIVHYYLGLRQATLAVAESCTGGLIAQRLTSVPGASRSFVGGVVVYSDKLKIEMAGVPAELIAQHGAVSAEVAKALAKASACAPAPPWASASLASLAPPAAPRKNPSAWCISPSPMSRALTPWNAISAAIATACASGLRNRHWTSSANASCSELDFRAQVSLSPLNLLTPGRSSPTARNFRAASLNLALLLCGFDWCIARRRGLFQRRHCVCEAHQRSGLHRLQGTARGRGQRK